MHSFFIMLLFLFLGIASLNATDSLEMPISETAEKRYFHASLQHLSSQQHFSNQHIHQWIKRMENWYPMFLKERLRSPYYFSRMMETLSKSITPHPFLNQAILSNHQTWTPKWFQETQSILSHFPPQSLSRTIRSFAKLRIRPPQSWLNMLFRVSQQTLGYFTPQDLSQIIYGFAKLNITPPLYWKNSFLKQCREKYPTFISQDYANILYSFALLDIMPKNIFLKNLDAVSRPFSWKEKNQLYLFHQYAHIYGKNLFLSPQVCTQWIEEFKAHNFNTISYLEQEVGQYLSSFFQPAQFIDEIGSIVDFYNPHTKTILQVDGPHHYLSTGEHNGSTLLQTRILKSYGYRVIRIHYQDWERCTDRTAFLENLLQTQ